MAPDTVQFNAVLERTKVCAGARPFQCKEQLILAQHRRIPELDIAEEDHSRRPPILYRVGKHISIHKGRIGLACRKSSYFGIVMPRSQGSLAFVRPHPEHVHFKYRLQFANWRLCPAPHAKPCLAYTEKNLAVWGKLIFTGRQF